MNKHFVAPIALSAAVLGLVGGGIYAGSALSAPAHKPAQVELVQPAAQVVTPTVDPAIAKAKADAAAKVKAVKVAKAKAAAKAAANKKAAAVAKAKVAAPVAVNSVQAPAPKPVTIQRQAVVSDPTPAPTTPEPSVTPEPAATTPDSNFGTVVTNPDGSTSVSIKPGQAPPPIPGRTPPPPTAS